MPRQARLDARPPAIVPKSHAAMAMAGRPELATRLPTPRSQGSYNARIHGNGGQVAWHCIQPKRRHAWQWRAGGGQAPGTLHHVIVRGIEKRRIVDDRADRDNFVSRWGQIASETETVIYAWALMTNHAHILLRSGPYGLSKCMHRFLIGYAITYNRRHHRYGHLFLSRRGLYEPEAEPLP